MDRRNRIAPFAIAIAAASSAALAEPPDFSPMNPPALESPQAAIERSGTEEDAQLLRREPAPAVPGASTYGAPAQPDTLRPAPAGTYVAPPPARTRERTAAPPPPTTAHAMIEQGLFNRRGPNDFGA